MHAKSESLLTAGLALFMAGYASVALAHTGGSGGGHGGGHVGGHGHGTHRGTQRGGDADRRADRGWRGVSNGYGWYAGRFHGGSGRLGYGRLIAALPWYCNVHQWGGVEFYYADDNYYQWNNSAGAYETVEPPPGLVDQVQAQAAGERELFIFTEAGQSNEQLARDRRDCERQAAREMGFVQSADADMARRDVYLRAEGACLMARNYGVE